MKKNKKIKKQKKTKTKEFRLNEITVIKSKLAELELDNRYAEIEELIRVMDNFVKTGESNSGKMVLTNSNKDICYILSNKEHINCQVNFVVRK